MHKYTQIYKTIPQYVQIYTNIHKYTRICTNIHKHTYILYIYTRININIYR